jgi:hypothetical protein
MDLIPEAEPEEFGKLWSETQVDRLHYCDCIIFGNIPRRAAVNQEIFSRTFNILSA